jgi:hypothetical protein
MMLGLTSIGVLGDAAVAGEAASAAIAVFSIEYAVDLRCR